MAEATQGPLNSLDMSPAAQQKRYDSAFGNTTSEKSQQGLGSKILKVTDAAADAMIRAADAIPTWGGKKEAAQATPSSSTSEPKKSFTEKVQEKWSSVRQAISKRLDSFNKAIDATKLSFSDVGDAGEVIAVREKEMKEQLKHIRDEAQMRGKEAAIRLATIAEEIKNKAVDATAKLAKTVGSNTVKALKIGINAAAEPAAIPALGVLGGPALVEAGIAKAIGVSHRIQEGLANSYESNANLAESGLSQLIEKRAGMSKEDLAQRDEADYEAYQFLRNTADQSKIKAQEIRETVKGQKAKVEKFRIFKRLINGIFKRQPPSIEIKQPFNT